MSANNLKDEILALPTGDRAELAEALLLSLSPTSIGNTLPQWLKEASDRLQAHGEGKLTSTGCREALDRVENSLQ